MDQPDLTLTYTEVKCEPPFDWNAFLAQDPATITEKDWSYADDLAADWVSCACGNQCSVIPRDRFGEPIDQRLAQLGVMFSSDIEYRAMADARQTLHQIEKRTAFLLTQPDYTDHENLPQSN